ncbi:MAG: glycoside hydrolase family 2 TIM barrel-domain containing protein, partial [Thermoanaerobaculia bacterium]|nr:glycoside hydrolase family 2 TIM barrel-domain containing protein [Thermoanaerobaculia bacterium]
MLRLVSLGALLVLGLYPPPVAASPDPGATTERIDLSGRSNDDAVPWDFRCRTGRGCGSWTTIPVPSSWELQGFGSYAYGTEENPPGDVGEYRLEFEVPARWRNRRSWLVFGGVMTDAEVRLNGEILGHHRGAFYPFRFEVSEVLRFPGPNRLRVLVHEESADGSVNRAERRADYWIFGGIFRPVWLESRPRESIAAVGLDPRADGHLRATVALSGIRTGDRLVGRIETLEGKTVGGSFGTLIPASAGRVELVGRIPGVEPWSAEHPQLYRIRLRLLAGNRPLHEITERFGFRTVEIAPSRGLLINGRKVRLKGVNRHSFWPSSGRTTNPDISREDVRLLRRMNVNAVRTSHYPPDEHFLDACDEAGIYVLDELAGWHDAYDTAAGRPLVRSMVERDRNHPSVVLWANGNEGGWNRRLDREFSRFDPQKRPVLHPDATFSGFDTEHYPDWEELRNRLGASGPSRWGLASKRPSEIVLPTEILHSLYDGGGAAGLERFWTAIRDSPRGGGLFLWAFLDEGVVRTDRGGSIDTAGNRAPDGVVGPFRQPEASVRGLREIFSPVELRLPDVLPPGFNGRIGVVNPFDHRTLGGR